MRIETTRGAERAPGVPAGHQRAETPARAKRARHGGALAQRGQAARSTICDLEVGYSAHNSEEWDQLTAALDAFTPVPTTAGHLQRAIQVQRLLAARSKRGRKIPDLLIAATAEEQGMTVLHYDNDFDLISEATGQPVEWVNPPGSISERSSS
jgi:hypothetical protein